MPGSTGLLFFCVHVPMNVCVREAPKSEPTDPVFILLLLLFEQLFLYFQIAQVVQCFSCWSQYVFSFG